MNVTPDSFYAGSRIDANQSINYTQYQHADIVDIGFESSRPGTNPLSEKNELKRLFDLEDVHLEFTPQALDEIVKIAKNRKITF